MSEGSPLLHRVWSFTKDYLKNVGGCYLEFVAPIALFLAFNSSAEIALRDNERLGLMWLNYSQIENDFERETKYPAHAPESHHQKKRLAAAQATEAVVSV